MQRRKPAIRIIGGNSNRSSLKTPLNRRVEEGSLLKILREHLPLKEGLSSAGEAEVAKVPEEKDFVLLGTPVDNRAVKEIRRFEH